MFQHTAARRRLPLLRTGQYILDIVSTHSRAEAAASDKDNGYEKAIVSTHSRAEAAAQIQSH